MSMFLEEDGKVYVIENNRVVASFDKGAYYGSCPHPECSEYSKTKYDLKKDHNCTRCGTSMKVEFPSKAKNKTDAEKKGLGEDKQSATKQSEFYAGDEDETPFGPAVEGEEENMEVPFANRQNEADRVRAWRQEQLMGMGFQDPGVADTRHFDTGDLVDIRAIENLINQGATPEQALSILSKVANPQNLLPNNAIQQQACPGCGGAIPPGGVCPTCSQNPGMGAISPGAVPPMPVQPMQYGARVAHNGKEGTIVSIVPTMYGDTYGVKFDNGKVSEFLGDDLSLLDGQGINYNSPLEKITSEFDKYNPMPDNTMEELERKRTVARSLNKEARAMILDPKLSMEDRYALDDIIVATSADLKTISNQEMYLLEAENQAYLARAPKYQLDNQFNSWGSVAKTKGNEDISWVYDLDVDFEPITAERLVNVAMESLANVSRENLQDDFFMNQVEAYAVGNLPVEAKERFSSIFKEARRMKLEEPVEVINKEAAAVNYDEFPDAALFL